MASSILTHDLPPPPLLTVFVERPNKRANGFLRSLLPVFYPLASRSTVSFHHVSAVPFPCTCFDQRFSPHICFCYLVSICIYLGEKMCFFSPVASLCFLAVFSSTNFPPPRRCLCCFFPVYPCIALACGCVFAPLGHLSGGGSRLR